MAMVYRLENYSYYHHYIKFQELYSIKKVMDTVINQKVMYNLQLCVKVMDFNAINHIFYWITCLEKHDL